MSMFDRETQLTKDYAPDSGKTFVLWEGEYIGAVKHPEFGDNQKATVTASEIVDGRDRGEKDTYTVYGVMADQIRRLDSEDLPAVCQIVKEGRANVISLVTKDLPAPF